MDVSINDFVFARTTYGAFVVDIWVGVDQRFTANCHMSLTVTGLATRGPGTVNVNQQNNRFGQ